LAYFRSTNFSLTPSRFIICQHLRKNLHLRKQWLSSSSIHKHTRKRVSTSSIPLLLIFIHKGRLLYLRNHTKCLILGDIPISIFFSIPTGLHLPKVMMIHLSVWWPAILASLQSVIHRFYQEDPFCVIVPCKKILHIIMVMTSSQQDVMKPLDTADVHVRMRIG
jgi:hypothetical protein